MSPRPCTLIIYYPPSSSTTLISGLTQSSIRPTHSLSPLFKRPHGSVNKGEVRYREHIGPGAARRCAAPKRPMMPEQSSRSVADVVGGLVGDDTLELGLEPLHGVALGHAVLLAHAGQLLPALGDAVAWPLQDDVEVHAWDK